MTGPMAVSTPTIAVILAAGGSTRFVDGPKQLARVDGRPMVEIAASAALEAGCFNQVVVVSGMVRLGTVLPAGAVEIVNPAWAEGQATSVQAGIAHARSLGVTRIVIGLADQPMVGPLDWRLVAEAPSEAPIVVAVHDGRRGNPVRLDASVWDELPREGDEGARALMRERPALVGEVACPGDSHDVDTVEDLDRWN